MTLVDSAIHLDYVPREGSIRPASTPIDFSWSGRPERPVAEDLFGDVQSPLERHPVRLGATVRLLAADGSVRGALPITFFERTRRGDEAHLHAHDASTSFEVDIEARLPVRHSTLHFHFRPRPSATPAALLPVLSFLDAMQSAEQLGIWSHASKRWLIPPIALTSIPPAVPDGYENTVRALARLQSGTGAKFPMPEELDVDDVREIQIGVDLLNGKTFHGRWQTARVSIDSAGLAALHSTVGERGALLQFVGTYSVRVAGRDVHIRNANFRFWEIKLANPAEVVGALRSEDESSVIELVPGANNRFDVQLDDFDEPGVVVRPDSPQAEQGADAARLAEYAGKWIAQRGDDIVAAGLTPQDVRRRLSDSGLSGAIWRVPRTRQEADAHLGLV